MQLQLFSINIKEEAVSFLKKNLSDKGEIFVAFSGGKDSIATAELMRLSGLPHKLFYSFTGIDPPELVRFIRKNYPECIFLKPAQSFWYSITTRNVPSDRLRWCCTTLKKAPGWKLPHKFRVLGIRAEESSKRAKYGRINHFKNKYSEHSQFYPIFTWNESELWNFIENTGLKYPSLYNEGFDRLGCVICPYHSEKTGKLHALYRERWPKYFDLFEKQVEKLHQKRLTQGKTMSYPSSIDFCRAWYKAQNAHWYERKIS